jgi:uncharacterized protein (TIGR03086 family)
MSVEMVEAAVDRAGVVLRGVTSDQYDADTPCRSWRVRDLINHMVAATHWFAESVDTGVAPEGDDDVSVDVTGGDVLAAYADGSKRMIAAFSELDAMDRTVKLPFADVPAPAFSKLAAMDQYVHAWDLAKATKQPTDVMPDFAEELLVFCKQAITDEMRGPEGVALFRPEVAISNKASAPDRLAAYLGRTP